MIPPRIDNHPTTQVLELIWPDGQTQEISHGTLRAACMCATCRAYRLRHDDIPIDPDCHVQAIHAQGYGLQLVFNDGHDRGIYPWQYLQQLGTVTA